MKPLVTAYIDAFNLCRRALRGTPHRWLDVRAMCVQTRGNVVVGSIKLVTAHVKAPKGDPGMTLRQRTYLEALQVHSGVAIHVGQCRRDRRLMESHPCEAHEVGAPALVETLVKQQAG